MALQYMTTVSIYEGNNYCRKVYFILGILGFFSTAQKTQGAWNKKTEGIKD